MNPGTNLEPGSTPSRFSPERFHSYLGTFATSLCEARYSVHVIARHLRAAAHLCQWAERHGLLVALFDERALERFKGHLSKCKCPRRRGGKSRDALQGAELFLSHLRERGIVVAPPADSAPGFGEASERFGSWLARQRGLKTVTIRGYQRYLCPFLVALGEDPAAYGSARISDFMIQHLAKRGRDDATHTVRAIRSYLRYLVALGRVPCELADCVPTVPQWRLSALPRYLEFADVERVIASCGVSTIKGLRDRAIILLLARLGVRSRDIIAMLLTDVDWERGTLRVRGKSRQEALLPLPQDVGDALLAFLEKARPRSTSDRMFLTVYAPTRPFTNPSTISEIVAAALERAGIEDPPSRGAHLLRHSAATAMLRAGASLDTIGAVLRHKSSETTAHYAKVDLGMLGSVTQPWPGVASC
jgi:integrase/recombinase XerD